MLCTLASFASRAVAWVADLLCAENCAVCTALVVVAVTYFLYTQREFILGGRRKRIEVPIPEEIKPGWKGTKFVESTGIAPGTKDIPNYDPATGAILGSGTTKAMTPEEVKAAVTAARVAQKEWAKTSFDERRKVLATLLDYVVEHQEDICRVASRDTGKTMVDGSFGEVLTTCEKLRWTMKYGESVLKAEYRDVSALMFYKSARVEYHPLGVLGAIIPWNYPFHNMFGPLISALFSGNAIVIKVSEYVCWSSEYYGNIVKETLKQLGHSPDLVQIIVGTGEAGNALVTSGIDKVTFIGSPGVGKLVMRAAAETLTPVILELGGKDAAIVCDDCDYDQIVGLAMRGTFQNCGQNCIGLERLIVNEKIYDRFVGDMEKRVSALSQGSPLDGDFDCGAMTMGEKQAEAIVTRIQAAVRGGARLLAGGTINKKPDGSGTFLTPTLLVDVTKDMDIAQHEVFGPVMTIFKARDDEHALEITNSCQYGLGSSVFSLNKARAESIATRIHTGMCNINDFAVNYLCQSLPFGGVKISGFDRFAGIEGLRGCCVPKAVTSDRIPGIRTSIPPPLQYPIKESGFRFCKGLIDLFYGDGIVARVKGAISLAVIGASKK
eukprot:m.35957 g.35957  ORF g.35957 m.35957 type:complete len:608 (+) comp5753_c0_seq1:41-1864(+)